jgi:hypothetical protein
VIFPETPHVDDDAEALGEGEDGPGEGGPGEGEDERSFAPKIPLF